MFRNVLACTMSFFKFSPIIPESHNSKVYFILRKRPWWGVTQRIWRDKPLFFMI